MVKRTMQLEYHAPNSRVKARLRNVTPTELDRLYREGMITRDLHDAGEAALKDLWRAKMLGPAAIDYNASGGGGDPQPISTGRANALKRVNLWLAAIDGVVGIGPRKLLLAMLCDDREISSAAMILTIRQALVATVKHHEDRRRDNKDPVADLVSQAFRL